MREFLPADVVVQNNPSMGVDRPSGLYGSRQLAISYNAPYNVPLTVLNENSNEISRIFNSEIVITWMEIDAICDQYYIDILVINDIDALWGQLVDLNVQRSPIYSNTHYSIYSCGEILISYP